MITNGKTNGKDKNEIRQLPQLPNDGVVGGAGPMGWVAGSGAKLFKGALGLVKNVLGRSSKTSKATEVIAKSSTKKINLNDYPGGKIHLGKKQPDLTPYNPTPSKAWRALKKSNVPGSPEAISNAAYQAEKVKLSELSLKIQKLKGSKPVNFKGPNPANKTGAGGNSYPIVSNMGRNDFLHHVMKKNDFLK